VLSERARKQRAHQPRGLDQALRTRGGAKLEKPGRDLRQEGQVIIGLRRALERDPQQRDRIRGEGGRKDGVAFDHAGIAVRGLLAGCAAIEERNRKPVLGEMQPNRGADNAGTEHDGIDARHGVPSQTFAPPACTRAAPLWQLANRLTHHMGVRWRWRQAHLTRFHPLDIVPSALALTWRIAAEIMPMCSTSSMYL